MPDCVFAAAIYATEFGDMALGKFNDMKIDMRSNKLYLDAKAALNAVNANSGIFKLKLYCAWPLTYERSP